MTKDSIYDYQVKVGSGPPRSNSAECAKHTDLRAVHRSTSLYVQDVDGKTINMEQYRGKVVLIINVASACGFTPQYKEQAALYDKYKDKGLVILGFPCNQAGHLQACIVL